MTMSEADLIIRAEVRRINRFVPALYRHNERKAIISLMYNAPKLQKNNQFLLDLKTFNLEKLKPYFHDRKYAYSRSTKMWHKNSHLTMRRDTELSIMINDYD